MPVKRQFEPRGFVARGAEHRGVGRALDARRELPDVLAVMCNEVDLQGKLARE